MATKKVQPFFIPNSKIYIYRSYDYLIITEEKVAHENTTKKLVGIMENFAVFWKVIH